MLLHDEWLLTAHRAAIHRPSGTAVLADLHLGYDAARRAAGDAVPNWEWPAMQARLAALLNQHAIHRLVVAGDLVEHARWPESAKRLVGWLAAKGVAASLLPGNHDQGLPPIAGLQRAGDDLNLGDWCVRHQVLAASPRKQVAGHEHPVVRLTHREGEAYQAPCFLSKANRLILPAFSEDASGLNVFADKQWRGYCCHAIIGAEVLDLGPVSTLPGRLSRLSGRRRSFWHEVTAFKTRG
jgi:putative SbcD/Mre11-related phosphoesterase